MNNNLKRSQALIEAWAKGKFAGRKKPNKPQTNFDKITASPEKLAEMICNNTVGCFIGECPHYSNCRNDKVSICVIRRDSSIRDYKLIVNWLKSEAKEEEKN